MPNGFISRLVLFLVGLWSLSMGAKHIVTPCPWHQFITVGAHTHLPGSSVSTSNLIFWWIDDPKIVRTPEGKTLTDIERTCKVYPERTQTALPGCGSNLWWSCYEATELTNKSPVFKLIIGNDTWDRFNIGVFKGTESLLYKLLLPSYRKWFASDFLDGFTLGNASKCLTPSLGPLNASKQEMHHMWNNTFWLSMVVRIISQCCKVCSSTVTSQYQGTAFEPRSGDSGTSRFTSTVVSSHSS